MMKPLFNLVAWAAAGILLAIVIFAFTQPSPPAPPVNSTQNATTPANGTVYSPPLNESAVNIILIDSYECGSCINGTAIMEEVSAYLDNLPNIRVASNITLESSSAEALSLIEQYNISKVPALLVMGDAPYPADFISAWEQKVGSRDRDGTFVSTLIPPPYLDLKENRVVGAVKGMAIRPYGCPYCADPAGFFYALEDPTVGRVYFANKTILDENSTEAQELIAKYNITRLPTVFVDSEITRYQVFSQITNLAPTGDGWYAVRDVKPPFVDLQANRSITGLVKAVLIVNSSCGDCMDINQMSDAIVAPNGMKAITLVDKRIVEAGSEEGQALIKKYSITMIPTLLYSPEIADYPGFEGYWKQENSTVESDGWFVFRSHPLTSLHYQNISG